MSVDYQGNVLGKDLFNRLVADGVIKEASEVDDHGNKVYLFDYKKCDDPKISESIEDWRSLLKDVYIARNRGYKEKSEDEIRKEIDSWNLSEKRVYKLENGGVSWDSRHEFDSIPAEAIGSLYPGETFVCECGSENWYEGGWWWSSWQFREDPYDKQNYKSGKWADVSHDINQQLEDLQDKVNAAGMNTESEVENEDVWE